MRSFNSQEIANIVWSFATLNRKADDLLDRVGPFLVEMCSNGEGLDKYDIKSIAAYMNRQEAALLAWSCAVLNRNPSQLMQLLYTALFGTGDDPGSLNEIYGDDGLQHQAIMSMLYVSQCCCDG